MRRPEPCVLFSQTFLHPQLDEFVDEVLFSEPVVISACEFIEQSASSASPSVVLLGATSPPSFALEVFVHCEGETRFRRLCHPFLYSPSSSNVLEVEAVVTNHLVVRGSYRSLSLVVYGNTAEDLGQFNIEVGLEGSLTNTVSSAEGKLEDLPPALYPSNLSLEDLLSYPKALSLPFVAPDISDGIKQLLELAFKILKFIDLGDVTNKVISLVVSAASSYYASQKPSYGDLKTQSSFDLSETRKELFDIYNSIPQRFGTFSEDLPQECEDTSTSKQLIEILSKYFHPGSTYENPQNKSVILWLSAALLLCSGRESCFHFVNSGGLGQLAYVFSRNIEKNSHANSLMLLGVVEQATRLSIGCEGFLGWWPREDETIPSGPSAGYNQLLKLLLRKQPHDVASLTTHILHRLRFYEVASRYESAVTSILGTLQDTQTTYKVTSVSMDKLISVKLQLKTLMKLINSRGPIEDPAPWASASNSLFLDDTKVLTYKSTCSLITSPKGWYPIWDIDPHLLFLLKGRGFFALSAALLSSPILRSETGHAMDAFVDIVQFFEAIILSLLFCRSGLVFLLQHPELSTTVVQALKGADIVKRKEPIPLRYASMLISKGFFCHPEEVGMIVELHLRVVNAVDRLLTSSRDSDEILWILWELCGLSRSYCGREALAALGHFPEAVSLLISTLHSIKEMDPVASYNGVSPLNLAVFHSSAEIFEVIVTDQTRSSFGCWIGNVAELDRALHSYSTGSNRKDAPTRLLEWIDASIIYFKKGASGLLQYSAVLATGGDAHIASTSILSSDTTSAENNVGDHSMSSVSILIENLLGKPITENNFRAAVLRDSSVAQLTTGLRILAFIAENSAVAAALYDEGAVMVIHAVVVDCVLMLERSSNNYDYLVDDGTEGNSTSDLLLERNREQSIVDLLIPCLVLLITLFQRLKETKEKHRNTKLMKALLQLHREMSPRLAACTSDLSSPNPGSALGLEAVCHLLVSALACWPAYGWTPGLFGFLVESLHVTTSLAPGPREACSLLCLLNDLLPEEGLLVWKNGTPMLSALRTLAVGTLLGPQKESQINWYLQPIHTKKLMTQLRPQLAEIGEVILHCAISTLVVVQDMVRVFINRIACLDAENACELLRPLVSCVRDSIKKPPPTSDTDAYKVYRLLHFLSLLLEHPRAKVLLLKEGVLQIFIEVLERCANVADLDGKHFLDSRNIASSWCIPASKCLSLVGDSRDPVECVGDRHDFGNLSMEDCSRILSSLLKLCKVLPVGRELLACLSIFKELGCCCEGQNALQLIFLQIHSSGSEEFDSDDRFESHGCYDPYHVRNWRKSPPLLSVCITLLRSLDSKDVIPDYAIEAVGALSSGVLRYCIDGKRDMLVVIKNLFGIPCGTSGTDDFPEENIKYIQDLTKLLNFKTSEDSSIMYQVKESSESLLLLLQKPTDGLVKAEETVSPPVCTLVASGVLGPSKLRKMADGTAGTLEDYNLLDAFAAKFCWECPENLRDRLSQTSLPLKRKMLMGDNSPNEAAPNTLLSRGSGISSLPSAGPTNTASTRRGDSFRLRKPNTSRPPSMHVDDYVARERNVDGTNSNVITVQTRVGSTSSSGRPPSIHVDEFMARQRDRQNPPVGSMAKNTPLSHSNSTDAVDKSSNVKPEQLKKLENIDDDDLQGIDIVFDGEEEMETDDKLPFVQQDVDLPQPVPVVVDQASPRSIVAETESGVNESSQFSHLDGPLLASNVDEEQITRSEFSSRVSGSLPDKVLNREPSISSERRYHKQFEDTKNLKTGGRFSSNNPGYSPSVNNGRSSPSTHLPSDSRTPSQAYSKSSHQQSSKNTSFQPPLPPTPPPQSVFPSLSQAAERNPSQSSSFISSPPGYHAPGNFSDSKYKRTSTSSPGTSRPPPPLPPTPPPYSAVYNQTSNPSGEILQNPFNDPRMGNPLLTSFPPLPLMPPMLFSRPVGSMPTGSHYASSPTPHQGENLLQNYSISQFQPSMQPLQSSISHLQPLQPPQILRSSQPQQSSQHRPPPPQITPEPGLALLQSPPVQMQMHQPVQVLQQQQPQVSPLHVYYQQSPHQGDDSTSQQQQDPGLSLQHYFSSPEAIESLLSDREKLCQLLEQHPKLMQMLQEKLGQR